MPICPRTTFRYSFIYDLLSREAWKEKQREPYPSQKTVEQFIHRLFVQAVGLKKYDRAFAWLKRREPKETTNTLNHVLVHGVHAVVYENIFTKARMERDKALLRHLRDYRRAWEIVEALTPSLIVKKIAGA